MDTSKMLASCEEQAGFDDATRGPSTPRKPTFNKWERDFLESIQEQYDARGSLTDKQMGTLEDLYARC